MESMYPFPDRLQRDVIVFMLENGIISFERQKIYRNNISFKRAMKNLHDLKIVVCKHVKNSSNEYKLTPLGEHVAELLKRFKSSRMNKFKY